MEKVTDLLARKYPQFNTAAANCFVSDALYQMRCENVDYLIVMEDDKFKGIITDHDIASKILFENRALNRIKVKEFMNTSLPVTTSDASLQSCMQLMEYFNARHVVIYDRFIFRGVVSAYDLMQEALHKPSVFFDVQVPQQDYKGAY